MPPSTRATGPLQLQLVHKLGLAHSSMLAVASNLFGKSSSLAAYTLHTASPSATPSSSSSNLASTSGSSAAKSFTVGLWKVVGATHKTTNKDVSVWIFEKRVLEGVRDARGKERVLEALRKEVRLGKHTRLMNSRRHHCLG